MPKYAVHTLVALKVAEALQRDGREEGGVMLEHRGLTVVGAIGPDLFFWAPDYEVCQVLLGILDAWDEVKGLYDATIGKVEEALEAVEEQAEDLASALAPGLAALIEQILEEAEETSNLFEQTLRRGALALALGVDDLVADLGDMPTVTARLFDVFRPPLQDGKGEEEWYWFDMLHYRYTGDFARALLENAETPAERAYALGYLTHVATDVVGHGYVNQIVGGPYRTHVQRHVVVENFMDAWAFREYVGGDIATDLVDWLGLPARLPDDVVDLIYKAFKDAYDGRPHPTLINKSQGGYLTKEDIRTTYELFKRVTEYLEDRIRPPKEPFSGVLDVLEEALEDWIDSLEPPSPPDTGGGGTCSVLDYLSFGLTEKSRECYEVLAESIGDWLEWMGEMVAWSFETIHKLVNLLMTALASLPAMGILGILYLIQLTLYKLLMMIRGALALHGLTYPPNSLLDTAHGRNLVTPYQCEFATGPYPAVKGDENCLQCPRTAYETPKTLPSSYPEDATPKTFMEELPLNVEVLISYAVAQSPEDTRRLYLPPPSLAAAPGQAKPHVRPMGSALEVAKWMIQSWRESPYATVNWNLDSDRGFGYKQWTGSLPTSPPDHTVEGEAYI